MIAAERLSRLEDGQSLPYLAWRLPRPLFVASTASAGGGLGYRDWIVNAQVSHDYARHDLDAHAAELAGRAGLAGAGVTMFTAAAIDRMTRATDHEVSAEVTVGLTHPTWACAPEEADPAAVGTINIVAFLPVHLSAAALLGALCTVTEAKSQALLDCAVPGTGTPSDAVTVVCPAEGEELFCGVRSRWGSRLARAVHDAIAQQAASR